MLLLPAGEDGARQGPEAQLGDVGRCRGLIGGECRQAEEVGRIAFDDSDGSRVGQDKDGPVEGARGRDPVEVDSRQHDLGVQQLVEVRDARELLRGDRDLDARGAGPQREEERVHGRVVLLDVLDNAFGPDRGEEGPVAQERLQRDVRRRRVAVSDGLQRVRLPPGALRAGPDQTTRFDDKVAAAEGAGGPVDADGLAGSLKNVEIRVDGRDLSGDGETGLHGGNGRNGQKGSQNCQRTVHCGNYTILRLGGEYTFGKSVRNFRAFFFQIKAAQGFDIIQYNEKRSCYWRGRCRPSVSGMSSSGMRRSQTLRLAAIASGRTRR